YEDDDSNTPGIQGGFPKYIFTDKPENGNSVTVSVTSSDSDENQTLSGYEGWNLLGNPFGIEISVDELLASINRALQIEDPNYEANANLYVWEPSANGGNGDYIALQKNRGKTIAPFQAFWIRINDVSEGETFTVNASLERNKLRANTGSRLYKENSNRNIRFELRLGDGEVYDDYQLVFDRDGSIATDIYDAFKLPSLNTDAISLFSLAGENKLMKNILPSDLEASLEIPLHFDAGGRESLSFSWMDLDKIPDAWRITLLDKKLNKEINLRSVSNYDFRVPTEENAVKVETESEGLRLNKSKSGTGEPRFTLTVSPGVAEQSTSTDIPESVKLNPNYPNPFNPATTISFELKEDSEVLLSIWNIVGQKVVTLVDGMKEAGEHTATWNASEMPSGIYIAQLEVGGQVFIRKMTLIK
ncbi:MAG: T9SS type A sorting domain-containing protein, partial [Candidatus Cyclobacteriaceae bacterium M2_1C_046]